MILNGSGGANTQSGAKFEIKTDLKTNLINAGINLSEIIFCQKHDFPALLKKHGIDMVEKFGKKYLPDEAFIYKNHLYIIEKKYQQTKGSVDEKIQTGPYKKLIYEECATLLNLDGSTYIYLLSKEFFDVLKYTKHQIPYLIKNGIFVYFDTIPTEKLFTI